MAKVKPNDLLFKYSDLPLVQFLNKITNGSLLLSDEEAEHLRVKLKNTIAFVNPKSGGQLGQHVSEKLKKFIPKENIYDLSNGGPKKGLEENKDKLDLRVVACGGDGTVGWVLSVIDEIQFAHKPAVGIIPLGTGNDLARALNWGGGFNNTIELIETYLINVVEGKTVELDRWFIKTIIRNNLEQASSGKNKLPLSVINNYFSIGVDAKVALDFHTAREKNPAAFANQTANKMVYVKDFTKELFEQKCKNLCSHIDVFELDEHDIKHKIDEHKYNSLLFLNIPSYSGGSNPWSKSKGKSPQSYSDGKIEVIGFKYDNFITLHLGGTGTNIGQASKIRIITNDELPMQIDGEPVSMNPCEIIIDLKSKSLMIEAQKL